MVYGYESTIEGSLKKSPSPQWTSPDPCTSPLLKKGPQMSKWPPTKRQPKDKHRDNLNDLPQKLLRLAASFGRTCLAPSRSLGKYLHLKMEVSIRNVFPKGNLFSTSSTSHLLPLQFQYPTPLKTNTSPNFGGHFKRKGSSSSHYFYGHLSFGDLYPLQKSTSKWKMITAALQKILNATGWHVVQHLRSHPTRPGRKSETHGVTTGFGHKKAIFFG